MHEFGTEFDGVIQGGVVQRENASTDAVAGFQYLDVHSCSREIQRGSQAGDAGADDDDVGSHCGLDAGAVPAGLGVEIRIYPPPKWDRGKSVVPTALTVTYSSFTQRGSAGLVASARYAGSRPRVFQAVPV